MPISRFAYGPALQLSMLDMLQLVFVPDMCSVRSTKRNPTMARLKFCEPSPLQPNYFCEDSISCYL